VELPFDAPGIYSLQIDVHSVQQPQLPTVNYGSFSSPESRSALLLNVFPGKPSANSTVLHSVTKALPTSGTSLGSLGPVALDPLLGGEAYQFAATIRDVNGYPRYGVDEVVLEISRLKPGANFNLTAMTAGLCLVTDCHNNNNRNNIPYAVGGPVMNASEVFNFVHELSEYGVFEAKMFACDTRSARQCLAGHPALHGTTCRHYLAGARPLFLHPRTHRLHAAAVQRPHHQPQQVMERAGCLWPVGACSAQAVTRNARHSQCIRRLMTGRQ
jgi:hypothetical protein